MEEDTGRDLICLCACLTSDHISCSICSYSAYIYTKPTVKSFYIPARARSYNASTRWRFEFDHGSLEEALLRREPALTPALLTSARILAEMAFLPATGAPAGQSPTLTAMSLSPCSRSSASTTAAMRGRSRGCGAVHCTASCATARAPWTE